MATVTPNYSWPVPTSTDLVKDGATAIEALGDAIDATVFALPESGLSLIKSQVIGTTVSSVNVTGAFSTTYDNYKIIVSGGVASATSLMQLKLGATVTGYYYSNSGWTMTNISNASASQNTTSFGNITKSTTTANSAHFDLENPFLSDETIVRYNWIEIQTAGGFQVGGGYLNNTTSYTDFTLTPSTGTYTGGTIYVYGYQK
jgi:hypothetical protein